MADHAPG